MRIWDARTGVQVARIKGIADAKFRPDGSLMWSKWTTDQSGTYLKIRTFSRNDQDPVGRAVARTPRCLTPAQRRAYYLAPEPQRWCIERRKWPYTNRAWRAWLGARDAGRTAALPAAK